MDETHTKARIELLEQAVFELLRQSQVIGARNLFLEALHKAADGHPDREKVLTEWEADLKREG